MLWGVVVIHSMSTAAAASLMETWRYWVQPELRHAEEEYRVLRAEQSQLPETMHRPDFLQPGYRSLPAGVPSSEKWVQVDLGDVIQVDDIVLVPAVMPLADGGVAGVGFPVRFRVELSDDADFSRRETAADFTASDFPDPGTMPVVIGRASRAARYVRVTAIELRGEPDNHFFALGELVVSSGNRNVAQGARVTSLDSLVSPRWNEPSLTDGSSVAGRPVEGYALPTNGYHGREESVPMARQWVQVDLGRLVRLEEVRLVPARPVDFPDTIGFGFPLRFKIEVSDDPAFLESSVVVDQTGEDFPNPGDRRVVLLAGGLTGRYVRVTAEKLSARRLPDEYVFALAEMEVMAGGVNVAFEKEVTESAPLGEVAGVGRWAPEFLVDGIAPGEGVGTYADWLSRLARRYVVDSEMKPVAARVVVLREMAEKRLGWMACVLAGFGLVAGMGVFWLVRWRQRWQMRRLRTRIAQDLHDDIGSNLGSIALMGQLGVEAAPDVEAMRSELEDIRRVAAETADSMHDIVWLISPGMRTAGDLASRLREPAGLLLSGLDWKLEVEGLGQGRQLSIEAQRDIFLVFKEVLHNIRQHAGAAKVDILLSQSARDLCLRVADDGCGFEAGGGRRGRGLANIESRAKGCGGRLRVETAPGSGTTVTLTHPLK